MAESSGRLGEGKPRVEKEGEEEEVVQTEEDEGGQKKKLIAKKEGRTCCTCGKPTKGHPQPWGKKCKNKDLINLEEEKDEDEEDDNEEDGEVEEEDESSELSPDSETQSEESPDEAPRRRSAKKSPKKKKVVGMKKTKKSQKEKETSTPRRRKKRDSSIAALSFVSGNVDRTIIEALSDKLDKMDATVREMSRRWENEKNSSIERSAHVIRDLPDNPSNTYHVREDIQCLEGVSDAQKELLDMGIVLRDTGFQHQQPVPGLRPVSDLTEVRYLKPHPGIPDKTIRQILQGEYCDIATLLKPEIQTVKDEKYETFIQNGQLLCKVKEIKREINSIVTWFEAWAYYEWMMGEYHGWQAYKPLHAYKLRIIDWHRKYTWSSVYSWDVELRRDKGGKSMNFIEYDAGLFAHHFDQSTYRQKRNQEEGKSKPTPQQPFRGGPGATAGTGLRQPGPGIGQYRYAAARPEACYYYNTSECYTSNCRRPHYCKQCAGPMPHFECIRNGRCSYSWNS